MCLAVPARVEEIQGQVARVDHLGVRREVSLALVPEVRPGDYVLIHAGYAIQHLLPEEGEETLALFAEIGVKDPGEEPEDPDGDPPTR